MENYTIQMENYQIQMEKIEYCNVWHAIFNIYVFFSFSQDKDKSFLIEVPNDNENYEGERTLNALWTLNERFVNGERTLNERWTHAERTEKW
jgi:hypothetical protein